MDRKTFLYPDHQNGIYRYEYPMINGIRQYIQIRGRDKRNPLLLFLHGGPGGSLAGISHIVHAGWEERFTVVNWDQRNSCKTYFANKAHAKEIAETGTMDDFVQDIEAVIAYLHTVYDFDKLILMGFSWGSAIGAEYAKQHPENLSCFIGVGQHIHYRDGVMLTCRKMLDLMPKDSTDAQKVQKILADFPKDPAWNQELMRCMRYYQPLSVKYIAKHAKHVSTGEILRSPLMNLREKLSVMLPNYSLHRCAYAAMLGYDFRQNMHFDVPVLFVFGEEETVCPSELLEECLSKISAPKKKIAVIPNASHSCYFDQPEAFMKVLLGFVSTPSCN